MTKKRDPKDMRKTRQRRKDALNKLGFENMGDLVKWVESLPHEHVLALRTIKKADKVYIQKKWYDSTHDGEGITSRTLTCHTYV